MGRYDTQQICLSGHQITVSYHRYPQHRRKRCPDCGAETMHACSECGTEIPGNYEVTGVIAPASASIPNFCENCGEPFPWSAHAESTDVDTPWSQLHYTVVSVARGRFEAKHYADAVEATMKAVNARVKRYWVSLGRDEKDGKGLMTSAFSLNDPAIVLADLTSESGRSEQEGYMHLFAGAMQGVRNPKAHDNIDIDAVRALHHLFLASLLMHKLDEAAVP